MFDARHSIGHYSSLLAIDRAREFGLGAAVVRNSTHNGAISYYSVQAARHGMMGVAATACAPHVAPHGGTRGLHGTNPISYAFPHEADDPVVFDLSTGHSHAKIKDHADREGSLPPGRVLDAEGTPTTDAAKLKNGWLLPVGGHVGFGLGLLVDALTAGLSNSPIGRQVPLAHDTAGPYYTRSAAQELSKCVSATSWHRSNRIHRRIPTSLCAGLGNAAGKCGAIVRITAFRFRIYSGRISSVN